MKICDRTHNRDHKIKVGGHDVVLGVETFHLCQTEFDLIRDFILNPSDWKHTSQIADEKPAEPPKRPRGRPRKYPRELPATG